MAVKKENELLSDLPERVVIFGVRWRRRKGRPLQLVNHVGPFGVVSIVLTQKAIADELKVPMSWVEYQVFERSK